MNRSALIVTEATPLTEPYVYVYDAQIAMLKAMCDITARYTELALKHGLERAAKMIDAELVEAKAQLKAP